MPERKKFHRMTFDSLALFDHLRAHPMTLEDIESESFDPESLEFLKKAMLVNVEDGLASRSPAGRRTEIPNSAEVWVEIGSEATEEILDPSVEPPELQEAMEEELSKGYWSSHCAFARMLLALPIEHRAQRSFALRTFAVELLSLAVESDPRPMLATLRAFLGQGLEESERYFSNGPNPKRFGVVEMSFSRTDQQGSMWNFWLVPAGSNLTFPVSAIAKSLKEHESYGPGPYWVIGLGGLGPIEGHDFLRWEELAANIPFNTTTMWVEFLRFMEAFLVPEDYDPPMPKGMPEPIATRFMEAKLARKRKRVQERSEQ